MQLYISSIALLFVGSILILTMEERGKTFSVLLSLSICCTLCLSAVHYLEPVMALIRRLKDLSGTGGSVLDVLMKTGGIALIGEFAALVCADMGQNALGKAAQLLSGIAVLWISIPMMDEFLQLLLEVFG